MRHSALLAAEPFDSFLKILAFFEKQGVIESISDWQRCRAVRNMAAHDYATSYAEIAEHFNLLHELSVVLLLASRHIIAWSAEQLDISPASPDFSAEFDSIFM